MSLIHLCGVLTDQAGVPLSGVQITLTSSDVSSINIIHLTGPGGDYAFALDAGDYWVTVKYPDEKRIIVQGQMTLAAGSVAGTLDDYLPLTASAQSAATLLGNDDIYPSIEAGLAATASGDYFLVPQGAGAAIAFIAYQNQSGMAVAVAVWPGVGVIDNLIPLNATTRYADLAQDGEYEFNPKKWLVLDADNNVLFDLDTLLEKMPLWDAAYRKSLSVEPQQDNPLAPFTVIASSGNSQIRVCNTATLREVVVTDGSSNETQPRPEARDRIVWLSDRAESVPGGLFYAALPDLQEHAYIARPHIIGWGHSFIENGVFMRELSTLSGLYSYNFGKGATTSVSIAARQGGRRISYMPVGGTIPASDAVNLTPNVPGPASNVGGLALSFKSTLAGVAGVFAWDGTTAKFTRDSAGDAVAVSETVPLYVLPITTNSVTNGAAAGVQYDLHDEGINVFWLGRNNIASPDTILECASAMVDYLKNIGKRVVICPDFPGAGETTGTSGHTLVMTLNARMKALYPEYYCEIDGVDLLQNFKNHHNPDFVDDVTAVQNGTTPPTLRYDYLHPSQSITGNNPSLFPAQALYIGAKVNAEFVYQFMQHKGWI